MKFDSIPYRITSWMLVELAVCLLLASCARQRSAEPVHSKGDRREQRQRWELEALRDPATGVIPERIRSRELAFASTLPLRGGRDRERGGLAAAWQWRARGPWNLGGRARTIGVDRTGEDTLITGASAGTIWRSSDGGQSWSRAIVPATFTGLASVVQDPRPGHYATWYATTGSMSSTAGVATSQLFLGDGVFRSDDNGRSWRALGASVRRTPQSFDAPLDVTWRAVVDPSNANTAELYVAAIGAIMRTVDDGATWRMTLGTSANLSLHTDVDVTETGVVYATLSSVGARRGVWRSTDGLRWTSITPQGWPTTFDRTSIAIDPDDQNTVFFLVSMRNDSIGGRLWRYHYDSLDGAGANGTWTDLSASMPVYPSSYFGAFDTQSSLNMHVRAAPFGSDALVLGACNLYASNVGFTDRAVNRWIGGYRESFPLTDDDAVINDYVYENHHPDQHWLAWSPTRRGVAYTATDGGIHRTDDIEADTVRWTSLNHGLNNTQLYHVSVDPATPGSRMIVGSLQDGGTYSSTSDDPQADWSRRSSEDGTWSSVAPGGREIILSKQWGVAWRILLDENGRVVDSSRIDPAATVRSFHSVYAADPNASRRLYFASWDVIWRIDDVAMIPLGNALYTNIGWKRLAATRLDDTTSAYRAVAVSNALPANRLWLGTDRGRVFRLDGADTATGAPVEVTSPSFPRGAYVHRIAVDPASGDRAVVVFSNYGVISLYITNDAGATWTPIAGNLEEQPDGKGAGPSVRSFAFVRQGDRVEYLVGTTTGLYSTSRLDGMQTVWQQEGSAEIGTSIVSSISVRGVDGYVAISTIGSGVFDGTVTPTSSVESVGAGAGLAATLLPNVTSGRTTLDVALEASVDDVIVEVYDRLGVLRMRREFGPHEAGRMRSTIDLAAGGIEPGRYYCQITAGALQRVVAVQVTGG